ncbi:MAG: hypothetical protein HY080_09245 [Gammaproteobacteria bacterium]|nr:hypothetical protein [Gammaproteobacteria bacterium]
MKTSRITCLRLPLLVLALASLLSGCSHSTGGASSSSGTVQGISTPGNVAVVTATNTN